MSIHERPVALLLGLVLVARLAQVFPLTAQESKAHHPPPSRNGNRSRRQHLAGSRRRRKRRCRKMISLPPKPCCRKRWQAKPKDYRAWFDLGYVYNATKRCAEAVEAYRKSVAAKPDVFESNLNLGILLARQGKQAEAAKYLKAATHSSPPRIRTRAGARLAVAGTRGGSTDPKQALAAYAEAAKLTQGSRAASVRGGAAGETEQSRCRGARVQCGRRSGSEIAGCPFRAGQRL